MRMLIWKEWREQSWRLGFGCVVLGAMALIGLRARFVADETLLLWLFGLGMTMLPVLASASLLAPERDEGSLESLLSLPVKQATILAVKIGMGIAQCIGPMAVAAAVSIILAGGREMYPAQMLELFARCALTAFFLFLWMASLTLSLPTEARAALLAMGVLIFWTMATAGLWQSSSSSIVHSLSPLCPVFGLNRPDTNSSADIGWSVCVQLVFAALLWLAAMRRLRLDATASA